MASSSKRPILNMPTKLVVNEEDGSAELFIINSSTVDGVEDIISVATSSGNGNNWDIKSRFVRRYNRANNTEVSQREFNQIFKEEIKNGVNRDRAKIINENASDIVREDLSSKLDFVENPTTGLTLSDSTPTPAKGSQSELENNEVDGDSASSSDATLANSSENNLNIPTKDDGGMSFASVGGEESQGPPSLEYPLGMRDYGPDKPDRLVIQVLNYDPRGLPTITNTEQGSQQQQDSENSEIEATIILPIPEGAQDGNIVGWGQGDMNAAEAALGELALKGMTGGVEGAKQAAENILNDIDTVGGEAKTAIAGILAGSAIRKGSQVLTRATGGIINPNSELLFDGPSLRTFSFQYKFSPREPAEAKRIFDIIKCLKKGMAVRRSKETLFLMTPRIFKLKYKDGLTNTTHKYLNRFKDCALTQLTVNYAPNQTYMAYEDENGNGSVPVSFDISMLFQELSPIFSDDYKNNDTMGF